MYTTENAKFGKLFRDLRLYDKKFTSTDTDIIFNRPEVKRFYKDSGLSLYILVDIVVI